MKVLRTITLLASFAFPLLGAETPVKSKDAQSGFTNIIDVATGVYGTSFGTSEEKFITIHGEPTGRLRLSAQDSALIYGKDHAFLFQEGKLIGVRITEGVFDWKVSAALTNTTRFDAVKWKLDNGIYKGMPFPEVQRLVGKNIAENHYTFAYRIRRTRVEIDFIQEKKGLDEKATVYGLLVKLE